MPEATVRHPEDAFPHLGTRSWFLGTVAASVALIMGCRNGEGRYIELSPDDIDVFLEPYASRNVRLGAVFVLTITGYDYDDRMRDIDKRLGALCDDLREAVDDRNTRAAADTDNLGIQAVQIWTPPKKKMFSATYVPIGQLCWASSSR